MLFSNSVPSMFRISPNIMGNFTKKTADISGNISKAAKHTRKLGKILEKITAQGGSAKRCPLGAPLKAAPVVFQDCCIIIQMFLAVLFCMFFNELCIFAHLPTNLGDIPHEKYLIKRFRMVYDNSHVFLGIQTCRRLPWEIKNLSRRPVPCQLLKFH